MAAESGGQRWLIPEAWIMPESQVAEHLVDYFEAAPRGDGAGLVRFEPEEIEWLRKPTAGADR